GEDVFAVPVGGLDPDEEGGFLAACGGGLVDAGAGDRGDTCVVADRLGELRKLREGLEVLLAQFVTGRQSLGVGGGPAAGLEEALCGGIEVVLPRGEQPSVSPAGDRRSGCRPCLKEDEGQAAFGEVGGGGQTDGSGT